MLIAVDETVRPQENSVTPMVFFLNCYLSLKALLVFRICQSMFVYEC